MEKIIYTYDNNWAIRAALDKISTEMRRLYWNKYHKEWDTPFYNTGESYSNDVFSVASYNWDSNQKPNFVYKDIKVWWYKHSNRGTYIEAGHKITEEDLNQMIIDCVESIEKDWGVK